MNVVPLASVFTFLVLLINSEIDGTELFCKNEHISFQELFSASTVFPMSEKMKQAIVKKHNQIRKTVANGDCFRQPMGQIPDMVKVFSQILKREKFQTL